MALGHVAGGKWDCRRGLPPATKLVVFAWRAGRSLPPAIVTVWLPGTAGLAGFLHEGVVGIVAAGREGVLLRAMRGGVGRDLGQGQMTPSRWAILQIRLFPIAASVGQDCPGAGCGPAVLGLFGHSIKVSLQQPQSWCRTKRTPWSCWQHLSTNVSQLVSQSIGQQSLKQSISQRIPRFCH